MKKEILRAEELSDLVYTVYEPQCKTIEKGEEARYNFEPLRGVITASVMFRFPAEGRGKQVLGLYSTEEELVLSVFCDGMGDGWPKAGNHKKAVLECAGPLWSEQKTEKLWRADFQCASWEPEWIFLRNPQKGVYERGGGELKLHPSCIQFSDRKNPTFAAVRQIDFECEIDTVFDFVPCEAGDEAGLAIVLSAQFYYRFVKKKTEEGICLVVEKNAEDLYQRACRIPVPDGFIHLKIRCDKEFYYFRYSTDGIRYQEAARASTRFLACEVAGRSFTGTVIGLYAGACRETKAVMKVKTFEMKTIGE